MCTGIYNIAELSLYSMIVLIESIYIIGPSWRT